MRFALAIVVFAVVAFLAVRRPVVGLPMALLVGLAVPLQAIGLFTGVRYSAASAVYTVLPLTWICLLAVPLGLLFLPRHAGPDVVRVPPYSLLVGGFVAVSGIVSLLASSGSGKVFYAGTVAGPLIWFTVIRLGATHRAGPGRTPLTALADCIVVVGLLEAALALVQRLARASVVFAAQYRSETWYIPDAGADYRSTGTMDHPLNLALLLLLVLALLLRRPASWRTLAGSVLAVAGIAVTASRAGIVVAAGLMAAAAVSRRYAGGRRLAVLAGLAAGAVVVLRSPVGEVLARRYSTDVSSVSIRANAYSAFGRVWTDYLQTGGGPGSSYRLAERLLFRQGSLESPWLMHAVDYGLPATVLLLLGIAVGVLARGGKGAIDRTAFLALAAMVSTYSSLSTASMSPYLFFTGLALLLGEPRSREPHPPSEAGAAEAVASGAAPTRPGADPAPPGRAEVPAGSGQRSLTTAARKRTLPKT